MKSTPSLDSLIEATTMGDRDALRVLYARTAPQLFGVCHRVLGDRCEAEDALQELYLDLWNATDVRVGADAGLSGTARSDAVIRRLVTQARAVAVVRRRLRASAPTPASRSDPPSETSPGQRPPPCVRLAKCLDLLHSDRAAMLRRVYLDGATYSDLSAATGIDMVTLRTWLRRSLAQLRDCLCQ
jgi:RNA polymerase sigma-70 factor (ECF subfamily)